MKGNRILQWSVKIASRYGLLKRFCRTLAIHVFPEEVETRIGSSRFLFRPKIDGFWYLNYSDAEPGVEKVLRENLSIGDTFVDIGAYIGFYSILARNIVGDSGKVIAFEPNPESYEMLKKNFELNGYKNCIAENIALFDEDGFFSLFTAKRGISSSSLFKVEGIHSGQHFTVKATTFDKYCKNHDIVPNLVKIDVEGAEYNVLLGAQEVISLYRPKLLIEIHPQHLETAGHSLQEFFGFLEQQGYRILLISGSDVNKISTTELVRLCKVGMKNRYGGETSPHILCLQSSM